MNDIQGNERGCRLSLEIPTKLEKSVDEGGNAVVGPFLKVELSYCPRLGGAYISHVERSDAVGPAARVLAYQAYLHIERVPINGRRAQ